MAQWVPSLSEFLFSSIFAGRFSYLDNSFHVTAGAIGSSFSPGSPEVCGKKFSEHVREHNVYECICSFKHQNIIHMWSVLNF